MSKNKSEINNDVAASEEDIIILDIGDSSDDLFPDISVTQKKRVSQNHDVSRRPSTSGGVGGRKVSGDKTHKSTSVGVAMQANKCGPSASQRKGVSAPKAGGSAKPVAGPSRVIGPQKHLPSSVPRNEKKMPQKATPSSARGVPAALSSSSRQSPETTLQKANRKGSGKKAGLISPADSHSGRFLDCMDLFTPSPVERPGEKLKQSSSMPKAVNGRERLGSGSAKKDGLISSTGAPRGRKHSGDFESRRSVAPAKHSRLSLPGCVAGNVETSTLPRDESILIQAAKGRKGARSGIAPKNGSQSREGPEKTAITGSDATPSRAGCSPRSPVPTLSEWGAETLPQNKTLPKSSLPPAKSKTALNPFPPKSKTPLNPFSPTSKTPLNPPPPKSNKLQSPPKSQNLLCSPPPKSQSLPSSPPPKSQSLPCSPPVEPRHCSGVATSSAANIITFQQNPLDTPMDSSLPTSKECVTEGSSMFDFNEDDLFQVLDSVGSESICSAYNPSDSESVGALSDNRPTSEASDPPPPSKLVTSITCRSPSESRVHDFPKSFVKRKSKRPQVARKSTTLNGMRFYKHPLKGRGRISIKRHLRLRLTRLHDTVVQKARKDGMKCMQTEAVLEVNVPAAPPPQSTKKREKRSKRSSSSTTMAKRPKLSSSDFLAIEPVVTDSTSMSEFLSSETESNSSQQTVSAEERASQRKKGAVKSRQRVLKSSKKPVQTTPTPRTVPSKPTAESEAAKSNPPQDDIPCLQTSPLRFNSVTPQKSRRPLPLILKRSKILTIPSQIADVDSAFSKCCDSDVSNVAPSAGQRQNEKEATLCVPEATAQEEAPISKCCDSDVSNVVPSAGQRQNEKEATLCVPEATAQEEAPTSEPTITGSVLHPRPPGRKRSASEQLADRKPSGEGTSPTPVRFSSQPPSGENPAPEASAQRKVQNVTSVPTSEPSVPQLPPQMDQTEGSLLQKKAQENEESGATPAVQEQATSTPTVVEDSSSGVAEEISSTSHLIQEDQGEPCDTPTVEPSTSQEQSDQSARLSQRDEVYDLRLLETIAKLAPSPERSDATANKSCSVDGQGEVEVGTIRSEEDAFMVKLPISQLNRMPSTSPGVVTRPLGMFKDASVQAERGMIVDKDVLDNYLVVKLHEAMLDMKAQLQMMEAQVVSIARQKESLERTLQAKTQYIRDMTTTGFKPIMADKGTLTDINPLSPVPRNTRTPSVTSPLVGLKSKRQKSVKVEERGFQTQPKVSTVSCQTEGFVRSVPSRLQGQSPAVCLYSHPESELQLYIEEGMGSVVGPSDGVGCEENVEEVLANAGEGSKWLTSMPAEGQCSRSVGVSQKVRFLRAIQSSSDSQSCTRCSGLQVGTSPQSKRATCHVCFCTDAEASGQPNPSGGNEVPYDLIAKECIPQPLHVSISKLNDLYLKIKALPKEPVQERHMKSLEEAVRHLLAHLPLEIELSTPTKDTHGTTPQDGTDAPPTTQPSNAPTTPLPCTPPSAGLPSSSSSPPSTPGAASWAMGAKMQSLLDVLQELVDKGRDVFPNYFKAELAQLQKKTKKTLRFLTVGLQHETFTHDRLGCIETSDIHPRPWRNRDLHVNPYVHRLFLDVGIRGLLQELKRLNKQNRKGRRLGQQSSEEDSDLELLCSPPPSPKHRVRAQTAANSRVRKRKVVKITGKKFKKSSTSKGERIHQLVTEMHVRKDEENITISASQNTKASSGEPSNAPSTSNLDQEQPFTSDLDQEQPFTSDLDQEQPSTSNLDQDPPSTSNLDQGLISSATISTPLVATALPKATTAVVSSHLTQMSPSQVSPYNSLIARGESFQVRLGELQSSIKPTQQPQVLSSATSYGFRSISTTPSNTEALGGDVNAQSSVAQCIQQGTQKLAQHVSTTSPSTSVRITSPLRAPATSSTTNPSPSGPSVTPSHAETSTVTSGATHTLPRYALRGALETLSNVLQRVQISPAEKESISKQVTYALKLSGSTYAIDLHMAQLLINQITQQLHKKVPSGWLHGGSNVVVRPLSPHMTFTNPTRSSFSNIVTPTSLPMNFPVPPPSSFPSVVRGNSAKPAPTQSTAVSVATAQNTSAASVAKAESSQVVCSTSTSITPSCLPSTTQTPPQLLMVSLSTILPSLLTPPVSMAVPSQPAVDKAVNTPDSQSSKRVNSATISITPSTTNAASAGLTTAQLSFSIQSLVSSLIALPSVNSPPVTVMARPRQQILDKTVAAVGTMIASTKAKPVAKNVQAPIVQTTPGKQGPSTPHGTNTPLVPATIVKTKAMQKTTGVQFTSTTVQTKQGSTGAKTTTVRATLSTTTLTTSACGDVRMSPSVAETTPLTAGPVHTKKHISNSTPPVSLKSSKSASAFKQIVVHCPRTSQPVMKANLPAGHGPRDSVTWRGIASLRDNAVVENAFKNASGDGKDTPTPGQSTATSPGHPSPSPEITKRGTGSGASNRATIAASTIIPAGSVSLAPTTSFAGRGAGTEPSGDGPLAGALEPSTAEVGNPTISALLSAFPAGSSVTSTSRATPLDSSIMGVVKQITPLISIVDDSPATSVCRMTVSPVTTTTTTSALSSAANGVSGSSAAAPGPESAPVTSVSSTLPQNTPTTISNCALISISTQTSKAPTNSTSSAVVANTATVSKAVRSTGNQASRLSSEGRLLASTLTQSRPQGVAVTTVCSSTRGTSQLTHPPSIHVPSITSPYQVSQQQNDPPVVKLQANKVLTGLLIKWTFAPEDLSWQNFVERYDLYAFVSCKTARIPDVSLWGKVGEIRPLALPMAVTLTNFAVGQRYIFAVQVRYVNGVISHYSNPCTIDL